VPVRREPKIVHTRAMNTSETTDEKSSHGLARATVGCWGLPLCTTTAHANQSSNWLLTSGF